MRFSAVSVALLAGVVAAVPQQSVQPITQISDGQIQAPPATRPYGASSAPPSSRPATTTPVYSVCKFTPRLACRRSMSINLSQPLLPLIPPRLLPGPQLSSHQLCPATPLIVPAALHLAPFPASHPVPQAARLAASPSSPATPLPALACPSVALSSPSPLLPSHKRLTPSLARLFLFSRHHGTRLAGHIAQPVDTWSVMDTRWLLVSSLVI